MITHDIMKPVKKPIEWVNALNDRCFKAKRKIENLPCPQPSNKTIKRQHHCLVLKNSFQKCLMYVTSLNSMLLVAIE